VTAHCILYVFIKKHDLYNMHFDLSEKFWSGKNFGPGPIFLKKSVLPGPIFSKNCPGLKNWSAQFSCRFHILLQLYA